MASLGDLMLRLGLDATGFNTALASVPDRLNQVRSDAEKAWAPLQDLGQTLMGVGAGLTAAVSAPLVGIGASAVRVSEQLGMANLAFTTMLGSGEKAQSFLAELQTFAEKTPFEFPELVTAAKRMMAMGFEAKQVVPTLTSIGDAAAALGGGSDFINGVTTALGQMTAKGKVSAEEMNQLAERSVPAWQFLADKIGVTVPEAMKMAEKGAIRAADAVPAILAGMNDRFGGQMAKAAETFTGVWSTFKDQLTMTLANLGKSLTPALTAILRAASPLLAWAKDAAKWFSELPDPIKNGALALGGLAAIAGPLVGTVGALTFAVSAAMPALTALAAFLFGAGATAGALVAPAVAIGAVTAALAALGTWVYQNWEPIKATVSQAWDGLTEAWSAIWTSVSETVSGAWNSLAKAAEPIWGPVRDFITGLWDKTESTFSAIWSSIAGTLKGVWSSIQAAAATVWGSIVKTFQEFLGWAQKIPGVNKLMNLDEAWNSAKKLQAETSKAADATQKMKEKAEAAAKGSNSPVPKLGAAFGAVGRSAKGAEEQMRPLIKRSEVLDEISRQLESTHKAQAREIAAAKIRLAEFGDKMPEVESASDALNISLGKLIAASTDISKVSIPGVISSMNDFLGSAGELGQAFETLGVKSATEYQRIADEAKRAYETIAGSGIATDWEKNNAMVRMLEAQRAAMVANGQQIPAEMTAMMEKLQDVTSNPSKGLPKVTEKWSDWSKQVSTIVTDFGKSIGELLFDGNKSWAEKGKAALSSMGEAVTRAFVEPATKAIGDLISGALSDLIGGKGFGGVVDRVKELGNVAGGVFGNSGGPMTGTSGAGRVPTGGGGGGGGTAGTGQGVMGAVNMATGIVSAVADVVTAIGTVRLEGTMNAIEHNTRYAMMFLGERADGGILGRMFDLVDELKYGTLVKVSEQVRDLLYDHVPYMYSALDSAQSSLTFAVQRLDQIGHDAKYGSEEDRHQSGILNQILDVVRERGRSNIVINVSGASSPQATANAIQGMLLAQGF